MMGPIIFDPDGTLIDSVPAVAKALNTVLEADGLPLVMAEETKTYVDVGAEPMIKAVMAGRHIRR